MSATENIIDLPDFLLLKKAFDDLESVLLDKVNSSLSGSSKKIIGAKQYEEALGILTIEKSELEQELIRKQIECDKWKNICNEVIVKLNLAINNMQSILNKEHCSETHG